ncbi:MAG: hypothetical protein OEM24_03125, partial [Paracoccaceae bacterium]|nr:hypothetical protein [Paracoccaceae bacterium]
MTSEPKTSADLYKEAAVRRLMLKEFDSWDEFDLASSPRDGNRRQRRANRAVMTKGVSKFLRENFGDGKPKALIRIHNELVE